MEPQKHVKEQFSKTYQLEADRFFVAPGRVNLIGEHIDYNGGYVFPCALDYGTYGAIKLRGDRTVRLASGNFAGITQVDIDSFSYDPAHDWANYPLGVIAEILKLGHKIGGFDLYVWGDIPSGAGLSSSASIEVLTAFAVNSLFDCGLTLKDIALLSQRAENQFVGVNCGVMDQYAVSLGKAGHAMLLDCAGPSHEYVPLDLGDYKVIIANTNKKRGLTDSKYNERRSECEAALAILQQECDINNLCDLKPKAFEAHKHLLTDPVLLKRAKHVVYENARTIEAVNVLNSGDIKRFGEMMNDSHESLSKLYEVTGKELEALADAAQKAEGVLGSRMTGAGFGGCTVSIVHKNSAQSFMKTVGREYTERIGLEASFYLTQTGDGVGELG